MRSIFFLSLLAVFGAAQAEIFLPENKKFGDGVSFENKKTPEKLVQLGTKNGYKYRVYHSDGSGRIAGDKGNDISYLNSKEKNWNISCKKDAMTDERYCSADRDGFLLFFSKKDGVISGVLGEKYPGSTILVRIGSEQPISAPESRGFSKAQTSKIIESAADGTTFSVRYVDWPYKRNNDKTSKIYNIKSVVEYMKWAVGD